MIPPQAMRPVAAAMLLGVHRETVYRWLREGRLPGQKIGGIWCVMRSDIRLPDDVLVPVIPHKQRSRKVKVSAPARMRSWLEE